MHEADLEVIFRQVHESGQIELSNFTDMVEQGVTIAGVPFEHRLIVGVSSSRSECRFTKPSLKLVRTRQT